MWEKKSRGQAQKDKKISEIGFHNVKFTKNQPKKVLKKKSLSSRVSFKKISTRDLNGLLILDASPQTMSFLFIMDLTTISHTRGYYCVKFLRKFRLFFFNGINLLVNVLKDKCVSLSHQVDNECWHTNPSAEP